MTMASIGDTSSKWLIFHGHVSFQWCNIFFLLKHHMSMSLLKNTAPGPSTQVVANCALVEGLTKNHPPQLVKGHLRKHKGQQLKHVALLIPHFNSKWIYFLCGGGRWSKFDVFLFDPFECSSVRHGMSIYCLYYICLICPWIKKGDFLQILPW